jgi:hypothetical protein
MEENAPNHGASGPEIRFACHFCGKQIHVPPIHAGKKGKCPQCKNVVVIPKLMSPPLPLQDDEPIRLKRDCDMPPESDRPVYKAPEPDSDLLLQPNPPRNRITADQSKDQQYEMLRQSAGFDSPQPPPQRKYPALVDVFMYPANMQGLIFLAIAVLVPLLIRMASIVLCIFGFLLSIFNLLIIMYIYWFLAQCVRDSASGGLRAPETVAETPGLWELLWQVFELLVCLALCAVPAIGYYIYTYETDQLFWCLAGFGAFIYPMALLSVIMFDSISGLNPLIIIPSIFSSFFQYCGLVVLISAIIFLYVQTRKLLPDDYFLRFVLYPLVQAAELYLAMMAMHLLGRFYFKYQGKLNWEV